MKYLKKIILYTYEYMSDTEEIDKKKEEETGDTDEPTTGKVVNFLTTMGGMILVLVIYYLLGGLILFSCKVAQSNVLPTDVNCAPYTNQEPVFKSRPNNDMNIFKSAFMNAEYSEKISISYTAENSKNQIMDILRAYKNKPDSNNVGNYIVSFIEKLVAFMFNLVNMVLNMINQLPEPLIILAGPFASMFVLPLIALVGVIYSIILWFTEMSWLFKKNTNETGDGPPKWVGVSGVMDYSVAWFLVLVFFWIFVFLLILQGFSCIVGLIIILISVTVLTTKSKMNNKNVGPFNIVKDVFRYYKVLITVIITLFVVLNAFGILGTVPGLFSILTVALIYFGVVGINLYDPIMPHTSPILPNDDQFIKSCSIPKKEAAPKGFFESLISRGGGTQKFIRDIKKISGNLKK